MEIIHETHEAWRRLINGDTAPGDISMYVLPNIWILNLLIPLLAAALPTPTLPDIPPGMTLPTSPSPPRPISLPHPSTRPVRSPISLADTMLTFHSVSKWFHISSATI